MYMYMKNVFCRDVDPRIGDIILNRAPYMKVGSTYTSRLRGGGGGGGGYVEDVCQHCDPQLNTHYKFPLIYCIPMARHP